jgi:hypothetical protein
MNKIAAIVFAVLSIFSVSALADDTNATDGTNDLYVGLNLFGTSDRFTYSSPDGLSESLYPYGSSTTDYTSAGIQLVFGALLVYDMRLQGYFQTESFDKPPFDGNNKRLNEFGLDLIKAFPVSKSFSPFIQGGIGYGWMAIDPVNYFNSTVGEFNVKLGAGMIFKVSDSIELLGGLDYEWRHWSNLDRYTNFLSLNYKTLQTNDTSVRYYVGINYLF